MLTHAQTQPVKQTLAALVDPELEPLFRRPARLGPDSAWYGHLPFAYWVMRAVRPAVLVELGTHAGISYSAFCEEVLASHLPTRCFAIDSWQGDEHAGFYGEDIFTEFQRFHDLHYSGFSRLLRCRFDTALPLFADKDVAVGPDGGGIDLLHIDGRHLLSDIDEDFNLWLPKLSDRAVVLLHDTNVRERDFGVWKFFANLRQSYPSFEFLHAHGLGVLAVGRNAPDQILELCRLEGSENAAILRERFSLAGQRWENEFALTLRDRQIAGLSQANQQALHDTNAARHVGEDNDRLRDRLLTADRFCQAQAFDLALLRGELADLRAARHREGSRDRQQIGALELKIAASELKLEAQAEASDADAQKIREHAALHQAAEMRLALSETRARSLLAQIRSDAEKLLAENQQKMLAQLAGQAAALTALQSSLSWRLTAPLRAIRARIRPEPAAAMPVEPPAHAIAILQLPALPPSELPPQLEIAPQIVPSAAPVEPPRQDPPPAPQGPREIRHLLFVMGEPGTPGAIYRGLRNAAACRAAGFTAEAIALYDVNPENLARADLLVLWRAGMSQHVETMIRLAREAGTRIAFDIDDLMIRPELARVEIIDGIRTIDANEVDTRAMFANMARTMLAADFCLATTEELASEMRQQREVVQVLPNSFDEPTHRAARYGVRHRRASGGDGRVRIGYAGGTRTHQKDFAQAASAIARVLQARPHSLLVLFREAANHRPLLDLAEFPELAGSTEQIEWRDMVDLADLPAELARFDISICPLEAGNPFCEAKSELKYFEAALAGVCTVASPTGPYRRAIEDGVTGLLATGPQSWETALLDLIDAPERRQRIARNAYHDVLWQFGPRRQAELAASMIGNLEQSGSSAAAARSVELGLRRADYKARGLPEIPPGEILFESDALGEAEVTVVMTSYNYQQHILEALDSVRAQTLAVLDLAVVDDGSTDQSVALVLEWARRHRDRFNRIVILRTVHNAGLGGARNVVFDAAETPWLMALDSDNRLLPDACDSLLAALRDHDQAAFAYPRIQQFGDSDFVMGEPAFDPHRLRTGNYIDAMAMVAKWAWAAAGGYYVRRDAMGWEDFDLWLNLVELGQFGVSVPAILAEYRVHGGSMVNAITEQSANKRAMVEFVEARHPWLRLRTRAAKPRPLGAAV